MKNQSNPAPTPVNQKQLEANIRKEIRGIIETVFDSGFRLAEVVLDIEHGEIKGHLSVNEATNQLIRLVEKRELEIFASIADHDCWCISDKEHSAKLKIELRSEQ